MHVANRSDVRFYELPANPLMLSIMCFLYDYTTKLPASRTELYQQCVEVLVSHRRAEFPRDDYPKYKPKRAQHVLENVACWMQNQPVRTSAPRELLDAEVQGYLDGLGTEAGLPESGTAFVKLMVEHCGILALSGEAGHYGFLHLRLQEYLAARGVVRMKDWAGHLARAFADDPSADRWREVVALSLRLADDPAFGHTLFRELLAQNVDESEYEILSRFVTESETEIVSVFAEIIQDESQPVPRRARLLRLFRDWERFGSDLLADAAETLVRSENQGRSAAIEILQQAGRPIPAHPQISESTPALSFVDETTGIAFVWIEPGTFQMGEGEEAHPVTITKGFWLSKYQVTNANYRKFLEATGASEPKHWDDPKFNGESQPSWE